MRSTKNTRKTNIVKHEGEMTKKIAITGGIGSGKSFVTKILKEMGFPVFSCDKIYAEVVNSHSYIENVCKYFPSASFRYRFSRRQRPKDVERDRAPAYYGPTF